MLPAFVIGAVVLSTIWGDNGLVRRLELQQELRQANTELRALQRDNQRRLRDLRLLDEERIVVERVVAEELGWATEGTTLYRFDDTAPQGAPALTRPE